MEKFNLNRFVEAQGSVYNGVVRELKVGKKTGHWMWYIFPQVQGLGKTPTAKLYSILSLEEVGEYLNHPILGSRLKECVKLTLSIKDKSAYQIFGDPDFLKFKSCLTLFNQVNPGAVFQEALCQYYGGEEDFFYFRYFKQVKQKLKCTPISLSVYFTEKRRLSIPECHA